MKRIAIDMDDVMADTLARKLDWYNRDFGIQLDRNQLKGKSFNQCVKDTAHLLTTRKYAYQKGFFAELPIKEDAQEVVRALHEQYEIFIVTAAMGFPNSFQEKYDWLQKYFPFIEPDFFVFCGHKYMIQADYLIDDGLHNLKAFTTGTPIQFVTEANEHVFDFERVHNWLEVGGLLL